MKPSKDPHTLLTAAVTTAAGSMEDEDVVVAAMDHQEEIFQVMRARAKVTTVPETKEVADATDHAKGITTTAATALFADHTTEEMGSLAKTKTERYRVEEEEEVPHVDSSVVTSEEDAPHTVHEVRT